jgi:hypothetical protein
VPPAHLKIVASFGKQFRNSGMKSLVKQTYACLFVTSVIFGVVDGIL